MSQVLLCIAMCLLATSISGMPQEHERPVTEDQTQSMDLSSLEFMCEGFNECDNTSESPRVRRQQPQPQPDQPQPDQPQLQVQPDNATEENPSQSCRCVPYFKCDRHKSDKGTVKNTSLASRRGGKCKYYLQVCCDEENIIQTEPTKSSVINEQAATL